MKLNWAAYTSLLWAAFIWYLTTLPDFQPSTDSLISSILSNSAHFFFFGVQAALLRLAFYKSNLLPLVLSSLYGLVIEIIQLNVPGRSFSLLDWFLDTLGALCFLY